jgi:beta-lactam-binding protein with PASTA domain
VELNIDYVIKDEYEEGTIISQSRTGTVTEGAKLTITVTKKSEVVETPEEGDTLEE